MKPTVKIYRVQGGISAREIYATSKRDAIRRFKMEMKNYITKNDKITVS
jgi:hypothetical protein